MAWRMRDVEEQRMRFVVATSRREKSLTELCAEFEISRPTGYGWLKRYQARGIAGMQEASRRPHHSPARTAAGLEQRVVELRRRIGEPARFGICWGRKGSSCRRARFIAFFCATSWCATGIGSPWRCGASRGRNRISSGRWTSKIPRDGTNRWVRCGAGRSQPLCAGPGKHGQHAGARRTGRAGAGVPRKRRAGRNADGSGCEPALQRHQHPQTQGKVERFHRKPDRGSVAPGCARGQRTAKLAERFSAGIQLYASP